MLRYPLIQRILHWTIAALVLGALAVGALLGNLGFQGTLDTFGRDATNLLYKYHKTFGVIILFAMAIRIVVKARLGKPAYAQPLSDFERVASGAVHGLLYLALVAMPVLGWLATGASGFPVEFFNWNLPPLLAKDKELGETLFELHERCGWLIMVLLILHIGAAIRHSAVKKDGVLQRML